MIGLAAMFAAFLGAVGGQYTTLYNGDFANGVIGWTRVTYGAIPEVSIDQDARPGHQTLRISSSEVSDTALAQDVPVTPGKLYELSGWVKTKGMDPHGAPVFGTLMAQLPGGASGLASGVSHSGDTDWTREKAYFVGPAQGIAHIALFFCGWGRGTGAVWFDDIELKAMDIDNAMMRVTREPLCPGRINPMQYGQFIEYLCDLVPSMWAEKLYDPSFEGLQPYKFVYRKETDFKEKPWYPYGETNRMKVEEDDSTKISGEHSKRITITSATTCEGGVAQDGISLKKGETCKFSVYVKSNGGGPSMRVRLFHGPHEFAAATLPVTNEWTKVSANLTPNGTDDAVTISIQFTGPGMFWLDSASLMPLDTVGGWRKDVVAVLKAMKPGVIRVGGSVMDDPNLGSFEWEQTIGDPDRRPAFPAWGGMQPPGAGLEEVVQLIQAVDAEPLICIRYEKKTPKDAADEVEYFNGSTNTPMGALRAKNGHPKPYHIKYWQVGNERYGEAYWHAVPVIAKAIRAVDPSIKVLCSFPSDELVKIAASEIDYVSPHQYDVADMSGTKAELDNTRRMIRENAGGKALKVGVTEWNTTAGDAGLGRAKLWTLANALACSRYHNLMHREADLVEIANRSNLTNSFCSGVIQTNRSTLYLTPCYYAQKLYSTLAGTRPLKLETEIPADLAPDTSATLSEDGKTLTIFAVNESTSAVRRKIDLSAFAGHSADAETWTLTDTRHSGSADVVNSFDDPERVVPVKGRASVGGSTLEYEFAPLSLTVIKIGV